MHISRLLTCAGVFVSLTAASAMQAQGYNRSAVVKYAAPLSGCTGGVSSVVSTTAADVTCADGLVLAQAHASSANGRTSSYASIVAQPGYVGDTWVASTRSIWYDVVTFGPASPIPASMRLNAFFTGVLRAGFADPAGYESSGEIFLHFFAGDANGAQGAQEKYTHLAARSAPWIPGPQQVEQYYFEDFGFEIPIANTGATTRAWFEQIIDTDVAVGSPPSAVSSYGAYATADFSHTGVLYGLRFYDANHDDITDSVDYQFQYGTVLAATPTPEPDIAVLVATGLLAVVGLARRRAHRT
ncbi:MAG: hypothetical protein JWM95_166 [Gemmatimonadetes bacterium]|nr:hypothetical protein [Gemmatimonadota bacterium]